MNNDQLVQVLEYLIENQKLIGIDKYLIIEESSKPIWIEYQDYQIVIQTLIGYGVLKVSNSIGKFGSVKVNFASAYSFLNPIPKTTQEQTQSTIIVHSAPNSIIGNQQSATININSSFKDLNDFLSGLPAESQTELAPVISEIEHTLNEGAH